MVAKCSLFRKSIGFDQKCEDLGCSEYEHMIFNRVENIASSNFPDHDYVFRRVDRRSRSRASLQNGLYVSKIFRKLDTLFGWFSNRSMDYIQPKARISMKHSTENSLAAYGWRNSLCRRFNIASSICCLSILSMHYAVWIFRLLRSADSIALSCLM